MSTHSFHNDVYAFHKNRSQIFDMLSTAKKSSYINAYWDLVGFGWPLAICLLKETGMQIDPEKREQVEGGGLGEGGSNLARVGGGGVRVDHTIPRRSLSAIKVISFFSFQHIVHLSLLRVPTN